MEIGSTPDRQATTRMDMGGEPLWGASPQPPEQGTELPGSARGDRPQRELAATEELPGESIPEETPL